MCRRRFDPIVGLVLAFLILPFVFSTVAANVNQGLVVQHPATNQYTISWSAYLSQGLALQSTTNLVNDGWTPVAGAPSTVADQQQIVVYTNAPNIFFRLACLGTNVEDVPDGQFLDTNCDGIDGDISAAIFVATNGVNSPVNGLTPDAPVQTISYALQRATSVGRQQIYVQAGTYNEALTLTDGISIYGGYDSHWLRTNNTVTGHTAIIAGAFNPGESQYVAVVAKNLATPVTLADLEIDGPTASTPGLSSYGVVSLSSAITLARVRIVCGNGAAGPTGSNGVSALPPNAGMNGLAGGNAGSTNASCDNVTRGPGGAGGTNTNARTGGAGGSGGTQDTSCNIFSLNFNATDGLKGSNGVAASGINGIGGNPGHANVGDAGSNGTAGVTGFAGSPGTGGSGSSIVANYFSTGGGSAGTVGTDGGGGGGGGGSGGEDPGTDSFGAGGGGGGAGGLAGNGGLGGGGGGGSFGVYAVTSVISVSDTTIIQGTGGTGGSGGNGAQGQTGGNGGAGGQSAGTDAAPGGSGGSGGNGGPGAGGGGGTGGSAIGIATHATLSTITNVTYSGGTAGSGGVGGTTPLGGSPGSSGVNGTAATASIL